MREPWTKLIWPASALIPASVLIIGLLMAAPARADHAASGVPSSTGFSAGFSKKLTAAALERTRHAVRYDPAYRRIAYPMGDVPDDRGVCSDVVIRAYRAVGIDLQEQVHHDMSRAFAAYPNLWGLTAPDTNIDHRRVPNLEIFFARHGQKLPLAQTGDAYRPGDIVTWRLGPSASLPHIGLVTGVKSHDGARPLIVHNVGAGPRLEDVLFAYRLHGHYRFEPS